MAVASKRHQLPKDIDPTEPAQPVDSGEAFAPLRLASLPDTWTKPDQWFGSEDLGKYLAADLRDVLVFLQSFPLADGTRVVELVEILKIILGSPGRWFLWGQDDAQRKPRREFWPRRSEDSKAHCTRSLDVSFCRPWDWARSRRQPSKQAVVVPTTCSSGSLLTVPCAASWRSSVSHLKGATLWALTLRRSLRARSSLHVLSNLRRPWFCLLLGRGATWT